VRQSCGAFGSEEGKTLERGSNCELAKQKRQRAGAVQKLAQSRVVVLLLMAFVGWLLENRVRAAEAPTTGAAVIEMEGTVQVSPAGSAGWSAAFTNQALAAEDRVRTGERSRAVVRLSDKTLYRLGELALVRVPPPAGRSGGINVLKGLLYFFHRDKPGTFPIETPSAYAVIIGTEFSLEVAENGATTLHLIDGRVEVTNDFGGLELASGESAVAEVGQRPRRTAALEAMNVVQWVSYYPGVLDLDDLRLGAAERVALSESLTAYRSGDLLAALAGYPAGRRPASDAEQLYLAALLLAVGKVEEARNELDAVNQANALHRELAESLRTVIAAVKFQPGKTDPSPRPSPLGGEREKHGERSTFNSQLSTALLAESYYAQAQANLERALEYARRAAEVSPNFGFAWARVAELEFGFGHIDSAKEGIERALALSSRNAQAWAVKGFLAAAENRIHQAVGPFDQAIAIDGALGNAWLGRGLCRIRLGDREGGRQDLQTAVVLEPQRAVLRSYLGKAFAISDLRFPISDWGRADPLLALKELELAQRLDPKDPTVWLYSALVKQPQNRINEAVRDLQRSAGLNVNRQVYRSQLLLDQDRAVRSVNLASAYADAGLADVAQREAGRAVDGDAGNYSAHLFLGNAYQAQRDLKGISQRFEATAVSEYLLANLLSPVGAGTLAQSVSQQEYSKLFEADGFGVASSTEYFSNGRWVEQGAQYGTFGNFDYALSAYYNTDNGQRPNNDLEQMELSVQAKYQMTSKDSLYLRATRLDAEGGDLVPRYDPNDANRTLRFTETQEPLLLAGYHREWRPGVHSLVLGGWFDDEQKVRNLQQDVLILGRNASGTITDVLPVTIEQKYRNEVGFASLEAQQIWQSPGNTLLAGGRYQAGDLRTFNQHTNAAVPLPPPAPAIINALLPATPQSVSTDFQRWSLYGYYYWRPVESLLLVGGVSYDALRFPANFRFAPVSPVEEEDHQLSPKAGLVWTPLRHTTARLGYAKSLGGVGFEQSFRLEPTQVAGFNQALRSAIPEAVTGANVAEPFETFAVSLEQQFGSGTFAAVSGELLRSKLRREIGVYDSTGFSITRGGTKQQLDYRENALTAALHQLVGDEWAFGAVYRVSRAELETDFVEVPASAVLLAGFQGSSEQEALLHRISLVGTYNHPSGFFGQFQALWYGQDNREDAVGLTDDSFWQFNAMVGWRFLDRRVEANIGLLNITGQDYRLNPLNLTPELPRKRTLALGLKLNF
jgi:Tfp pilus assembly protein PilF